MSDAVAHIPSPGGSFADAGLPETPQRSYLGMVLNDTLRRVGTRVGLVWLSVIAICAVFAPFIANSYPYVVTYRDGSVGYPLFRYLGPTDVLLPIAAFWIVLVAWLGRRARLRTQLTIMVGLVALTAGASYAFVSPPDRSQFSMHRERVSAGEVDWAITAPIPYSPRDRQRDLDDRQYMPPTFGGPHWMGTERNGADVLSRMIHASRIALAIGFIATGIAVSIGIVIGGFMGYFSGIVDLIGMRLVEIFAAIPTLFLLLTLIAVMPPEWNPYRLYVMMVIIGMTGWVGYARFTRAEFLKLRGTDYVSAARALGLPLRSILMRHMLPNGVAPVLVEASFGIAGAILTESFLSFLGLGLVDEPSWGQMLSEAISATGSFKWWMAIFPGGAIFLTVFAYNLVGEALRDAIDPHTKRAAA